MRHARAVMHVGIANPRWRGKRAGIPGACATHKFTYLSRGPLGRIYPLSANGSSSVQVMTLHLPDSTPFYSADLFSLFSVIINWAFLSRKWIWKCRLQMSAILSRPQCSDSYLSMLANTVLPQQCWVHQVRYICSVYLKSSMILSNAWMQSFTTF